MQIPPKTFISLCNHFASFVDPETLMRVAD